MSRRNCSMRLRAGALVSVPAGEVLFVGWALAIENYGIGDSGFATTTVFGRLIPNPYSLIPQFRVSAAPGHCGYDGDLGFLPQRRGQPLQESHILIVDKDIHKTVHPAITVHKAGPHTREPPLQILDEVDQRVPAGLHHPLVSREFSQWCRNPNLRHLHPPSACFTRAPDLAVRRPDPAPAAQSPAGSGGSPPAPPRYWPRPQESSAPAR